MMDEQERRKKELLEQVLARRTAAEKAKRYTLQEAEETDADLRAAEAAAQAEAAEAEAAEAAKKGEEARGSRGKPGRCHWWLSKWKKRMMWSLCRSYPL